MDGCRTTFWILKACFFAVLVAYAILMILWFGGGICLCG